MAQPLSIAGSGRQQHQYANVYGSSPIYGSSPPLASSLGGSATKSEFKDTSASATSKACRSFFMRIKYGDLEACEHLVGYLESTVESTRKSGVEAWSLRVQDKQQELPFEAFVQRFGEEIPFHRIVYFKHVTEGKVWEADSAGPSQGRKTGTSSSVATPGNLPPLPPHHPMGATPPSAGAGFLSASRRGSRDPELLPLHHHPISSSLHNSGVPFLGLPGGGTPPPPGAIAGSAGSGRCLAMPRTRSRSRGLSRQASSAVVGGSSGGSDTDGDDGHSSGGESSEGEEDEDEDELTVMGQRLDDDGDDAQGPGLFPHEPQPLPELPEEVWMKVLHQLPVRDICMVGRANAWLRGLAAVPSVWRQAHRVLFGEEPSHEWNGPTVRRMCRRSELKAARWLDADVQACPAGWPGTSCLQMDDSKVVSGDGPSVRLWSHATGRRIATLQGHTGRVTSVAFDDELLVSGCTGATVRLWGIDDLKLRRTLKGHDGAVTAVGLMPGGIPISAGEDGRVKLWDVATNAPIIDLAAGGPVRALHVQHASGYLVTAGAGVHLWDVSTAQLLHTLASGSAEEEELWGLGGPGAGAGAAPGGAAAEGPIAAAAGRSRQPFSCVAYNGNLLAAGRAGAVVVWDTRTQNPIGTLHAPRLGSRAAPAPQLGGSAGPGTPATGTAPTTPTGAAAAGVAAEAAGAGAAGAAVQRAQQSQGVTIGCAGVQLDDWKLVAAFSDVGGGGGGGAISVHDIRAAGRPLRGCAWQEPVLTLRTRARINCFQFHEQLLLAGMEGQDTACTLWRFLPPLGTAQRTALAPSLPAMGVYGGGSRGGCGGSGAAGAGGAREIVGGASPYGSLGQGGHGSYMEAGMGALGGEDLMGRSPGDGEGGRGGKGGKKKPQKQTKKQGRYPKRSTK